MIPHLLALLLLQATAAPAPVCSTAVAPPPGLEAWSAAPAITDDAIEPGKPAVLTLLPATDLTFALAPERKPANGTFGGIYRLAVATAGTYRVALQAGVWIDLVRDGKALLPIAHAEGAACSGIRKVVDFALQPGVYPLQLSGAKTARMTVLVATK